MLHQCLKYVGTQELVKIVYAEKQLFRGFENYFTDAIICKDEQEGGTDDENEVDAEPDDNSEKASFKLNPLVVELSVITINLDVDNEGKWVLNKNPAFEYI